MCNQLPFHNTADSLIADPSRISYLIGSTLLESDLEYSTGSSMPDVCDAVTRCLDLTSVQTLALSLTPKEDWWSDLAVEVISRSFSSMQELRTLIAIQWPLERFYQLVAGPRGPPDTQLMFRGVVVTYLPHLPPIMTVDEILHQLLAPGIKAAEQLRHFTYGSTGVGRVEITLTSYSCRPKATKILITSSKSGSSLSIVWAQYICRFAQIAIPRTSGNTESS